MLRITLPLAIGTKVARKRRGEQGDSPLRARRGGRVIGKSREANSKDRREVSGFDRGHQIAITR